MHHRICLLLSTIAAIGLECTRNTMFTVFITKITTRAGVFKNAIHVEFIILFMIESQFFSCLKSFYESGCIYEFVVAT